ncbi:MAG: hypothetical protein AB8B65_14395 [Kordia sp.]|uniref:hypothetical protein n=1 Tax=Kordia sp. TaxID=1965332 RepID=UPI00385A414B
MTDDKIIAKATKALKKLNLFSHNYFKISVSKTDNEILLETYPELKNEYSVDFDYKLPDGRGAHTSVKVDTESHKLLRIITKSNMYHVPDDLR